MDLLASPARRKVLFGLLYFSEGAPIGFIWLGLPTRMRADEIPVERITWLMAILILPWTLKFLWAPLVDLLRGPRWGYKHWILCSQAMMAVALLPLLWLDIRHQFSWMACWLMLHAVSAATQDIAIDALCIEQSDVSERGALNGWMQCGVLTGRAVMGGGSLVLEHWIGFSGVVLTLIGLVLCSAVLLAFSQEILRERARAASQLPNALSLSAHARVMYADLLVAIRHAGIWLGLLFALIAPAAFKSLEVVIGPFLIDHGYTEFQVGQFTGTVMIAGMIAGSLAAGRYAARFSSRRFLALAIGANLLAIATLALADLFLITDGGQLLVLLTIVALTIGWLTVALYDWLMNLTEPTLAATQFTAFMAATNACEAWSTSLLGRLQAAFGYPVGMLVLCAISAAAAMLLLRHRPANVVLPMH